MPHRERVEPAACDHPQDLWLPLCEHAGTLPAVALNDGDVGRRVESSRGSGVLGAVRHVDDVLTQALLLTCSGGEPTVASIPAGEVVRIGWPRP